MRINPLARVKFIQAALHYLDFASDWETESICSGKLKEASDALILLERELGKLSELLELTQAATIEAAIAQLRAHFDKEKFFNDIAVRQRRALINCRCALEPYQSQGPCDTTGTERFSNPHCHCPTYDGNLGPCVKFEAGSNFRCCYCDHEADCHDFIQQAVADKVAHLLVKHEISYLKAMNGFWIWRCTCQWSESLEFSNREGCVAMTEQHWAGYIRQLLVELRDAKPESVTERELCERYFPTPAPTSEPVAVCDERLDSSTPSCHVCGCVTQPLPVVYRCFSCGTTTEPSGPVSAALKALGDFITWMQLDTRNRNPQMLDKLMVACINIK